MKRIPKKNYVLREIAMAARFPFFRLKVEMMEWMVARGIPQRCNSEMHTCRNRGGAQQRRPRWNVLTHNEIVLFHGSLEAVGSFRFSPCSKHVPYPRISVYPVFENSPSTCHRHPTNFIHFERRNERKICSLSSPPLDLEILVWDKRRKQYGIIKFLPLSVSSFRINGVILNNWGNKKKKEKQRRKRRTLEARYTGNRRM